MVGVNKYGVDEVEAGQKGLWAIIVRSKEG